jgi:hypothetical protein
LSKSAYIKLVKGSNQEEISLEEVKNLFLYYREMVSLTGKQLDWNYHEAAFPYEMEEREQDGVPYLLLKGKKTNHYFGLIVGVAKEEETGIPYIQVVLPNQATHGDAAKGTEVCKFLAKQLKGELHLFNGRIMYFNDRK